MGRLSRAAACVALLAAFGLAAGCGSGGKSTSPRQTGSGGAGGDDHGIVPWDGVSDPWAGTSAALLTIESDAVVLAPDYLLTGTVAAGVTAVSVALGAGAPQPAAIAGSTFSLALTLAPGLNALELVATDAAGAHRPLPAAVTYRDGAPTTAALIDVALEASRITSEQALTYRVFAAFGDARLPSEYRGGVGGVDATNVMAQLSDAFATLSPAASDALAPFFVPDFYVQSGRSGAAAQAAMVHRAALTMPWCSGSHCDLDPDWLSTDGTHVRVWWHKTHPDDAVDATSVRDMAETFWGDLHALFGHDPAPDGDNGGDARLDILIADMGGQPGVTITAAGCSAPCPAYIKLQRKPAGPGAIWDAALHELMHAFTWGGTFATGKLRDYVSISEATATWAVYRYLHGDLWEQRYNSYWMDAPERGLFSVKDPATDLFTYGTWIFYAWYWDHLKNPALGDLFISRIWRGAAYIQDQAEVVDQAIRWLTPFTGKSETLEDVWPKFVAAAWNGGDKPALKALDLIRERPRFSENTDVIAANRFPLDVAMTAPGARYYRWRFPDPGIRTLLFLDGAGHRLNLDEAPPVATYYGSQEGLTAPALFPLPDADKRGVVVQGIRHHAVRTGGWGWTDPENWTTARRPDSYWDHDGHVAGDVGYAFLCPEERPIEELDVAISYGDVSSPAKFLSPAGDAPRLVASNDPCFNLAAKADTDRSWSDDLGSSSTWRYAYEGYLQSFDLMWDPTDAGSGTILYGISFSGQTTRLAWSMSEYDATTECSASGSGTVPPTTDMSPALVYVWANAPVAHAVDWGGFSSTKLGDPPPDQAYTVTCPPPPPPPPDPNDPNPPPDPEPTTTLVYFKPVGFGLGYYRDADPVQQAMLHLDTRGVMHVDLGPYEGTGSELTGTCELKAAPAP